MLGVGPGATIDLQIVPAASPVSWLEQRNRSDGFERSESSPESQRGSTSGDGLAAGHLALSRPASRATPFGLLLALCPRV